MKILHALPRHAKQLGILSTFVDNNDKYRQDFAGFKYICVVIDGPESIDRKASWASSFDDYDTHKMFQALAEQTRP